MRLSEALSARDWASVFATTNSTPSRLAEIILLTALQPAPPTPTTTMRGFNCDSVPGALRFKVILASN